MDQNRQEHYASLFRQLQGPVFLLEDGRIVLRSSGTEEAEYALSTALQSGALEGSSSFVSGTWNFTVTALDGAQLVQASPSSALNPMLSSSSRALRVSLSEMLSTCSTLIPTLERIGTPEAMKVTAGLNHSFYQMLRTVSNMELAATPKPLAHGERGDLCAFLSRLCSEASPFADYLKHPLSVSIPQKRIIAYYDEELIVRGVMNLLANALQFSVPGTGISVSVSAQKGNCVVRVSNQPAGEPMRDPFNRSSQPSFDPIYGAGLGLTVALRVAQVHGGTLVYTPTEQRVTAAISISTDPNSPLSTPSMKIFRNTFDRMRVELADVLPAELYRADEMP